MSPEALERRKSRFLNSLKDLDTVTSYEIQRRKRIISDDRKRIE